jgi:hypothetical protein
MFLGCFFLESPFQIDFRIFVHLGCHNIRLTPFHVPVLINDGAQDDNLIVLVCLLV